MKKSHLRKLIQEELQRERVEPGQLKGKDMSAYVAIQKIEKLLSEIEKIHDKKLANHPLKVDTRFKTFSRSFAETKKWSTKLSDLVLALAKE
jgi:hypothetical protein